MDLSDTQAEEVRKAVADFKKGMELRGELNLRVARRVTSILRAGMFSFGIIAVILVGMLIAFTSRVSDMIVVLDTMRVQFSAMSSDMQQMNQIVDRMDKNMQSFPVISAELGTMRLNVSTMNTHLKSMSEKVKRVEYTMRGITTNVGHMNQSFRKLEPSVRGLGGNINNAAEPMKTFNSFFPW
ncbi:MAG: hypothetical protein COB46_06705 [Rhodospirillaceae bacterium]|nr:MAG: hypothetical protein COB46_06705 [Rhodospirillaceae bacterium]